MFLAVEPAPAVRRAIWAALAPLRAAYPGGRWVPEQNLHLTLKFIGDTPAAAVARLTARVGDTCRAHRPFTARLRGVGTFGRGRAARVSWIGLDEGAAAMAALAADLGRDLDSLGGGGAPRRPYRAHLTVARCGRQGLTTAAERQLERFQNTDFGRSEVASVALVQSHLGPAGPRYQILSRQTLDGTIA